MEAKAIKQAGATKIKGTSTIKATAAINKANTEIAGIVGKINKLENTILKTESSLFKTAENFNKIATKTIKDTKATGVLNTMPEMLVNRSKALVSSGIETLTSSFNSTLTELGVNISYGNLLRLIANANKLERLSKIIVTGRTKGVLALSGLRYLIQKHL